MDCVSTSVHIRMNRSVSTDEAPIVLSVSPAGSAMVVMLLPVGDHAIALILSLPA